MDGGGQPLLHRILQTGTMLSERADGEGILGQDWADVVLVGSMLG